MAKPIIQTFNKSIDQIFKASQKAVRDLGYQIEKLDKDSGLINFKTGMSWNSWAGQSMSILMIDEGDGSTEVTISGVRNQSGVIIQVYDWGEAKKIAKKVFDKMDIYL